MNIRIIPRLDIKGSNLIKGIHLEGLRVIGDPNEYALKYYNQGADELIFIDSVASLYGRNNLIEVLRKTAQDIFVPITVGGGIRNKQDAYKILRNGGDKVAINTAAIKKPTLIRELAKQFGSQSIVLSIEAKKINKSWEAYTHNGREKTGVDVIDWIKKGISLGAGEILLTSVDNEGTRKGFDIDLIKAASKVCSVPLVLSGGLGEPHHIKDLFKETRVDGIAIASALHYNLLNVKKIKKITNKYNLK
tara:strand:+ start:2280 stop:3023 length:744 start_codon:yes stop_codon:yes gene_type:complete